MALSRREFLTQGAVVGGVLGLGWVAVPSAGAASSAGSSGSVGSTGSLNGPPLERDLLAAMRDLHESPGGPPAVAVAIGQGTHTVLHTVGAADLATGARPQSDDHMRLASISKAFGGAAVDRLVGDGILSWNTTVGTRLAGSGLPPQWSGVTLAQLLGHTSGIPDFSATRGFQEAVTASPYDPPPPRELLDYLTDPTLLFPPGSAYAYSNSDNIIVGLMIEDATGRSYEDVLADRVFDVYGLSRSTLPRGSEIPLPFLHGYNTFADAAPEDVSTLFAAGWAWASGGIVSTPADSLRFIRGYVRDRFSDEDRNHRHDDFRPGTSEPPGPGVNYAGLAMFRYDTRYGTVFGHSGNTAGYTQFVASSEDGLRGLVVSATAQLLPDSSPDLFAALRSVYELSVGVALAA